MNRSLAMIGLIGCVIIAALSSCARMDQRLPPYDAKVCPFCTQQPGVCSYCEGNGKCTFCKGTGKRTTVSPDLPEANLKKASYVEDCPFCKATGKCRYCDGKGKCWVCKATGKIESWDFYEQSKQK